MKSFQPVTSVAVMAAVLGGATLFGASAPVSAAPLATCRDVVARTKGDLSNAGAPTNANDWQAVRAAAQRFLNSHPWGSPGTQALQRDVNELGELCAP
ncbi:MULTISPECIES: hypothetical protein [unclassified Streptomyces]|uniref:hypothetical protein n=1 Tax=unclassified Streptomyces TaxID=2593676 RepID=UPI000DC7A4CB|nr:MULTISPECIES: hypothetical protein [unclassified Streptomyces]AWZ06894.1 hypothetical protein DRB89_22280 [Streptomyces sp. ICC4]AWZ13256.1 hypothetical protein DRB96_14060 [Streptomyces sp. ICC1]